MSNEEYKQIIIEIIKKIEDQQILISIYIIQLRNFRTCVRRKNTGGIHMSNEEYKQIIIEIIKKIEDQQILISIYTVAKNLTE